MERKEWEAMVRQLYAGQEVEIVAAEYSGDINAFVGSGLEKEYVSVLTSTGRTWFAGKKSVVKQEIPQGF